MTTRRITILHLSPPYGPGDIVGLPEGVAERFVAQGAAVWADTPPPSQPVFAAMARAELLAHAAAVLGLTETAPDDVTDDELRAVLQAHADGMPVPPPADEPPPSVDQLDALDRAHLEAFARTKAGITEIDPDLSDEDLRAQIRALYEASVSATVVRVAKKTGRKA